MVKRVLTKREKEIFDLLITNKTTKEIAKKLGISEDKKMVLCYGGSGGSEEINEAMLLVIKNMVREDVAFIFATGKLYYNDFIKALGDIPLKAFIFSSITSFLNTADPATITLAPASITF